MACIFKCQKTLNCNLATFNKSNNDCKYYTDYLTELTRLYQSNEMYIYKPIYILKGQQYLNRLISVSIYSLTQLSNKNIACGLSNGKISILNYINLSTILTIDAHLQPVNSLDSLKNGNLVSGSDDSTIKIWNPLSNILINTLYGHVGSVYIVKVLQNGDIASGGQDLIVRIWDSNTGSLKQNLTGHTSLIFAISQFTTVSIVTADYNCNNKIWNEQNNGTLIHSFNTGFSESSNYVCNNGDYVAGSRYGSLRIYDHSNFLLKFNLIGHNEKIFKIIQLDNNDLASCSADKTIKIWDWNTKQIKYDLNVGHSNFISGVKLLHNGYMVSAGFDGKVIVWK